MFIHNYMQVITGTITPRPFIRYAPYKLSSARDTRVVPSVY